MLSAGVPGMSACRADAGRDPRAVRFVALAASALVALPAHADPPPLHIDYEAAAGCPGIADFLGEIQWRTSLARIAGPTEHALEVHARIVANGPVLLGRLVLGGGKGAVEREVASPNCDEVVSALALITALALDPHASTAPKPPTALPPSRPAPSAPEALAAPRSEPTTRGKDARVPPQIIGEPLPASLPSEPPRPTPRLWSLGARFMTAFAVAPRPYFGGGVFLDRAFDTRWRASVRLTAEVAATGNFDIGPGGASFLRGLVRVEGCAFALEPTPWLRLIPCLGVEGGAIRAEGLLRGSLVQAQESTVAWVGVGVLPRLDVDFGTVVLEAQGGPTFPAIHHEFIFQNPRYEVYDLPAVTWTVAFATRVRFP
jgi:hypothetical protein